MFTYEKVFTFGGQHLLLPKCTAAKAAECV